MPRRIIGSPSNSSPSDVFSSYRGLSSLRINTNSCATVDPHDDQDAAKLSSTHAKSFKTLLKDSSSSSCFASSSGSGKTSLAASSSGSSRKSMSGSSSGGGMDSYCSLSSLDSLGSPSSKSVAVVPVNYNEEHQDQYGRVRRRPDHISNRYNDRNKSHSRRRSRSSSRPYSSNRSSAMTSKTSTSGKTYTQSYVDLPLEWWERSEGCKEAKLDHMDRVDNVCSSREELVLLTTLWRDDIVLEPNMFPYDCPYGVEHYTLWSVYDLSHREIQRYVDGWLSRHYPEVRRWQYDDNSGERSIELFHVHVFIEMIPYSFHARPEHLYLPPHLAPPCSGPGPSADKDYERNSGDNK